MMDEKNLVRLREIQTKMNNSSTLISSSQQMQASSAKTQITAAIAIGKDAIADMEDLVSKIK